MAKTIVQNLFVPFRKYLPERLSRSIRSIGSVFIGPALYYYHTGYFRSCLSMEAVSRGGEPLPWYTYPSIEFLKCRDYDGKSVLEFGGGQSTLWWACRADRVVTLEGDREWYETLQGKSPGNVELHYVSMEDKDSNIARVEKLLSGTNSRFDIIVIDGMFRYEMIEISLARIAEDGIIICDNAEGYGFFEGFKESGLNRVDFFGNAPGIVLPHCTSIFFGSSSFVFSSRHPIPESETR